MPRRRPLPPLLVAAALAVGVAGCGSDDPTTTAAVPVTPVATTTAPADGATAADGAPSPSPEASTDPEAVQGSRGRTTDTAPTPGSSPLSAYAEGGRPATAAQAREVRGAFRAFSRAIADRDAQALCARTVGFEELLRAQGAGGGSCASLFKNIGNGAAGPSKRDLAAIDDADVVIRDDHATLSLGGQTPVPMRRVAGAWKVDYAAFAATADPKG